VWINATTPGAVDWGQSGFNLLVDGVKVASVLFSSASERFCVQSCLIGVKLRCCINLSRWKSVIFNKGSRRDEMAKTEELRVQ
jgi:hypothetical protein